ncbi:hypothetical protein MSPP1_003047 [Malassezia sp. CBS 17886]|nr:hypothetical protein MSPP1_003047 [Malassezia sp. CBS 17886]
MSGDSLTPPLPVLRHDDPPAAVNVDVNDDKRISSEEKSEESKDPDLVTWVGEDDPENPRCWPASFRHLTVVVVSCYTLLMPMTSSMNAPALDTLMEQFNVTDTTIGKMMMSSQMLALVLAPMVYGPMSETYGRKNILQVSNIIFLIFNVGCGLSKTATQMIVLRFFAGLAGCAPLSLGAGTVADLFTPDERGTAMSMYTLSPVLGPCIGPIFAGWIIQEYGPEKWPWIFWVSTMFGGLVALAGVFTLRETYAPRILDNKAARLRKETGNERLHTAFQGSETYMKRVIHQFTRPMYFLFTQPVVLMPCIYQALMYGCQYLLLAIFPSVYRDYYGQPPGIASLHYLAYLVGFLVTGQIGGRMVDRVYRRLKEKNGGVGKPEYKLPVLLTTGILMPAGLLIFGWTVRYHCHWIAPDIGIVLIASGVRGALFVCPLYLADSITMYTASAVSAAVMTRGAFGFAFPLFADDLYSELGQGWGNSLLALITLLVGLPGPALLYYYGERLRQHSPYSRRAMDLIS